MKADNLGAAQALSEQEIANHKALIDFNEQDEQLLKAHAVAIEPLLDKIVDDFYQRQLSIPEINHVINKDNRLPHLKETMKQYIRELFSGNYDRDYVARRVAIGKVHESLGVPARYYLAAVYQLENLLRETIDNMNDKSNAPLRSALHKVMHFDVQLVMDNFIENLLAKVRTAKDELEDYADSLEEVVTERTRQLHELSRKDELTELVNRDGMVENLHRELANAARYQESISFVCFTLNGYRQLVGQKGQAVGNVVLNQIGHDIKTQIREADIACRVSDDEFCIIMPRTIAAEAEAICNRLIDMFEKDNQYSLSFGMGIATTGPDKITDDDSFIRQVEDRMHKAVAQAGFSICTD